MLRLTATCDSCGAEVYSYSASEEALRQGIKQVPICVSCGVSQEWRDDQLTIAPADEEE